MKRNIKLLLLGAVLSFVGCSKQIYTADIDTSYYRINGKYDSDEEVDEIIAPYKAQLDKQMNEIIAIAPTDLYKSRPNSNMGNWFTDVVHAYADAELGDIDFAAQNYGGLRVPSLSSGPITVGEIFELMPFENLLVVLEVDGETLQLFLDRIAEKGGWPISHGLKFTIDNEKATNIVVRGEEFNPDRTYRIAIPDYIANGGDNCYFFKDLPRETDMLIRDIVIDYLRENVGPNNKISIDDTPRIATLKR
mgnify:CR=1 FL=1